jgi:hypothetical protein
MNIIKLLTGIWSLCWLIFSIVVTMPIWIFILAYDMGSPNDNEDRVFKFFAWIARLGCVE